MKRVLPLLLLLAALAGASAAPQLQILLPLGREAYQTNEQIDISVIRSDVQALPAESLALTLTGEDGSALAFTFPLPAVALANGTARATEHLHVNGWLLRPGTYVVQAAAYGATASAKIGVYNAQRRTAFKLLTWGRVQGKGQVVDGEDGFGFNLYYAHYGGHDQNANIRGGMDYMPCCTQSGGHQMDLRLECDWSDPNVLAGGRARVSRRALVERTKPNCLGIHFYDEPGLTWWTDPATGKGTNNNIPAQMRSFKDAYGFPVPYYKTLNPANPTEADQWRTFARWKTSLMDAAWQDASFAVKYVKPDFMTATQSQYGWSAFSDGYYFHISRNLSVTSGHGGYHDWGPGYWHPSFTLEVARARDFSKPCWYLPGWYGNTTSDHFRLEQYLSFMTNIQGMMSPPDLEPATNPGGRTGITESNKLMGRFGTVFTTMPVTRGPVAILYSLSHLIHAQTIDRGVYYAHVDPHGEFIHIPYMATRLMQQNSQFIVDEDIVDGTLAANYRTVLLSAVSYLDPEVKAGLERFAAKGGLVLLSKDSTVEIKGAVTLNVAAGYPAENHAKKDAVLKEYEAMKADPKNDKKVVDAKKAEADAYVYGLRASLQAAQQWVRALAPVLAKAGVSPVLRTTEPGIAATRQAQGDVEYLFAVNATHDFAAKDAQLAIKPVKATLTIADDGRPVYDGIRGGAVSELKANVKTKTLAGAFSFGAGEMRIFARTARPIGKVLVPRPTVTADTTLATAPVQLTLRALVLDTAGDVLVGSFPLRVRVLDPLGDARFDLYRATACGELTLPLPLAANDPAGTWTVEVSELLNNTTGTARFTYAPPTTCGAMAGATPRAVYFGIDRENMKRFFRVHKEIVLVTGGSDFSIAAAQRLAAAVKPWGIRCTTVDAKSVNKAEPDPNDQWLIDQYKHMAKKTTWCGPGGFDVPGAAVVLFGNPEDNPLIKGIADQKVLPYEPKRDDFPGRGRGMIAWQLDSVRQGLESITAIAYDANGMSEAVGCLYETVAAQDPITPLTMPAAAEVTPATKGLALPGFTTLWSVNLPDRADNIAVAAGKVTVYTHDGTATTLVDGKVTAQVAAAAPAKAPVTVPPALVKVLLDSKLQKDMAVNGSRSAITYWGGTLQLFDGTTVKAQMLLPQDISAVAWSGNTLVVVLATGQTLGLAAK
jgi:hypothetical protein